MARGRKKALTLDEQFEQIIAEIEKTEKTLEDLKTKKKEIEEKIKTNRIAELDEFITSRGLSIEEVKELLKKEN